MLNTNTTITITGTSKLEDTGAEILGMEARVEYYGSVNIYKRISSRTTYLENKAQADADYAAFEKYANGIIENVDVLEQ